MPLELRVKIKNSNKSSSYKDLIYPNFNPLEDPCVKQFIDEAVKSFGDDPEKVSYSLHEVIQ